MPGPPLAWMVFGPASTSGKQQKNSGMPIVLPTAPSSTIPAEPIGTPFPMMFPARVRRMTSS